MRAAANPFSVCICSSLQSVSGCLRLDVFDEVCLSTDIRNVARAQKLFCSCILWPIFRSDADRNNFPLEISNDSVSVISNDTKGLTAK